MLGPIVAVLSFVCSVGNAPLAAVLWAGGISFAGVIAFIYADLLIIPIVIAYVKYYGRDVTARLVAIMFAAMVLAALAVDAIFSALGLVPSERPSIDSIASRGISWNYTTFLNIVFFGVAAALFALTLRRGASDPPYPLRRRAACTVTTPSVRSRQRTADHPAALIRRASSSRPGQSRMDSARYS